MFNLSGWGIAALKRVIAAAAFVFTAIQQFKNNVLMGASDGTTNELDFYGTSGAFEAKLHTSGLVLRSVAALFWSNASNNLTTLDTGIARGAAGVLKVTDGAAGNGSLQANSFLPLEIAAPAAPASGGIIYVDSTSKLLMCQFATGSPFQLGIAQYTRRTATQTVTDSATLVNDNALIANVITGKKYKFRLVYYFTTVNTSGFKVDLGGGSATVVQMQGDIQGTNLATPALLATGTAEITTLTTAVGITASGTNVKVEVEGTFAMNGSGTVIPRFAQNAETGAAESIIAKAGSFFEVIQVPA